MPEIKNQFTSGKMNKDLDERIVPKGEYRDAQNIQVSTSDGSDVGSVQNILGNTVGCPVGTIDEGSFAVGSIADEKNDSLYWFISGQSYEDSDIVANVTNWMELVHMSDSIWQIDSNGNCQPVFVDKFAFSQLNISNANTNILDSVSPFALDEIDIGWTVTGVNSNGTTSNTAVITDVSEPIGLQVDCQSVPTSQSVYQSVFVGPNYNPMVAVGTAILIPMLPGFAAPGQPPQWFQSLGNVVYIQGFVGNISNLQYQDIIILPDDPANSQTFQILSSSNFTITYSNGMGFNVVKLVLDGNLSLITPSINNPTTLAAGSNAPYSSVLQGNTINAEIIGTVNSIVDIANGWLNINPSDLDVATSGLAVGDVVTLIGPSGMSGSYCVNQIAGNSIRLEDCNTGVIIEGWQVGGFLFGVPQPITAFIYLSINQTVQLETNIDLSSGYESLLFRGPRTLNFNHNQFITGINIIDDMLFWTDNKSEPKKINIPRSIEGTPSKLLHTKLINKSKSIDVNSNILAREEHITVIKRAPKSALLVDARSSRDPSLNYSGIITISTDNNLAESTMWAQRDPNNVNALWPYDFSTFTTQEGSDIIYVRIKSDLSGNTTFNLDTWQIGSRVVLKEFEIDGITPPALPINDYTIKGTIVEWLWQNPAGNVVDVNRFSSGGAWGAKVAIKVTSIARDPMLATTLTGNIVNYGIDLFDESEKLFEFKFPRFSYRYKYEDGEYSTFAPWSEVAFVAGSFDYHPKKGYNLGMTNSINHIFLRNFVTNDQPKDVIEIDLLYKEEGSPNVYIIDNIRPDDDAVAGGMNVWDSNQFLINKENVRATLPSNQMLRPWDNVPRKALAQEITGNRVVYGNYLQNYDLKVGGKDYKTQFFPELVHDGSNVNSIKSLREYQLGVVFTDKYGRETPVISHNSGTFKIDKADAAMKNKLQLSLSNSSIPQDMEYFKFYIKETSGEYYNMAMDRFWDAQDGNVWVSFASTDRNKIDIDSFLILKKGVNSEELVKELARFKVIAIENEAPDWIKRKQTVISDVAHSEGSSTKEVFLTGSAELPTQDDKFFSIQWYTGTSHIYSNSAIKDLHEPEADTDIYFQFLNSTGSISSKKYKISKITLSHDITDYDDLPSSQVKWNIILEKPFIGTDINKFTDDPSGDASSKIKDGVRAVFWSFKKENSPEFDGRFFVKLFEEDTFTKYIAEATTADVIHPYNIESTQKIYSFKKNRHSKVFNSLPQDFPGDDTNYAVTNSNYSQTPEWAHYMTSTDTTGTNHGVSGTNWRSHQAFFRGLNVHKADISGRNSDNTVKFEQHAWNKRRSTDSMSKHVAVSSSNWLEFEDVFFIDGEVSTGSWTYSWGGSKTGNNYTGQGLGQVLNPTTGNASSMYMEIGFGGIQSEETKDGDGDWVFPYNATSGGITEDPDFFDIANNNKYKNNAAVFLMSLTPGQIFRWAEDPHEQAFIIRGQSRMNLLRHESTHNEEQYNQAKGFTGADNYSLIQQTGNNFHRLIQSTFYRPDNYSKNYRISFEDHEDSNQTMKWNPFAEGPITSGLNVVLTADSTGMAAGGNAVTVTTLTGPDAGPWGNQTVSIGMCWDYGSTTGDAAVIYKISGNTLYFKNYKGNNPTNTFPAITANGTFNVKQYGMNGLSNNSVKNINFSNSGHGVDSVGYTLELLTTEISEAEFPRFPAIWETEPKDLQDLDIYYEISDNFPTTLNNTTIKTVLPVGSSVNLKAVDPSVGVGGYLQNLLIVGNSSTTGDEIIVEGDYTGFNITAGDEIISKKPNGDIIHIGVLNMALSLGGLTTILTLNSNLLGQKVISSWHNCYSFGNGVESNRIRDNFNQVYITNGVKASSTIDEPYKEERRKYGLIYSGIYNSISGVNNLNQFIQAEKITKDVNPNYGSIQKLHSRSTADGDLITLCEDRILKILANKDAVFNADGNSSLTATENVLGQAMPYSGEYGISKNPESFASEAYRVYFTDKIRGAVMRLSKDGLTAISSHGMKDWFKDNLKLSSSLVGSHDDKKDEYNITLDNSAAGVPTTVSFREDVRGWVSFKSFFPENAVSCANEYYTFKDGLPWRHHAENTSYNTFYNVYKPSTFTVVLNEISGSIKSFKTLNYEGSQSKVKTITDPLTGGILSDGEYYNLTPKNGWYVKEVVSDKGKSTEQKGSLNEFIEKEGKWFNYIKGKDLKVNNYAASNDKGINYDGNNFAHQGIGRLLTTPVNVTTYGCTDSTAFNFNPLANVNQVSALDTSDPCVPVILGCIDSTASNYNSNANTDDGSCVYVGCTDGTYPQGCGIGCDGALNYNPLATVDDGSCLYCVYGCTDDTQFNYDPTATCDDNSCIAYAYGCTDNFNSNATNYDPLANADDGSCGYSGCIDPVAMNYLVPIDTNSQTPDIYSTNDDGFSNVCWSNQAPYNVYPFSTTQNHPFPGPTVSYLDMINNNPNINGVISYIPPCATIDDGSCDYLGCTDDIALNYDPNATVSETGTCLYCGDSTAFNFDGADWPSDTSNCEYCPEVIPTVSNISQTSFDITWANPDNISPNVPGSGLNVGDNGVWQIRINWGQGNSVPPYTPGSSSGAGYFQYSPTLLANGTLSYPALVDNGDGTFTITVIAGQFSNGIIMGGSIMPNTTYAIAIDTYCINHIGGFDANGVANAPINTNYTTSNSAGQAHASTLSVPQPVNPGCMDNAACNYDPNATVDDGSCIQYTLGCHDSNAYNYAGVAGQCEQHDASLCIYQGCMDPAACNYDVINTIACCTLCDGSDDNNCCNSCGDGMALNFSGIIDPSCTGSCTYCQEMPAVYTAGTGNLNPGASNLNVTFGVGNTNTSASNADHNVTTNHLLTNFNLVIPSYDLSTVRQISNNLLQISYHLTDNNTGVSFTFYAQVTQGAVAGDLITFTLPNSSPGFGIDANTTYNVIIRLTCETDLGTYVNVDSTLPYILDTTI